MRAVQYLSRTGMVLALLLFAITSSMAAIQVEVNGNPMSFGVAPTQVGGRTMVPLRGIFEALGAQVDWNAPTRLITATKGDTNVQLAIGSHTATVNGRVVDLDTPAMILSGSTMVPLRFVSEALGADVKWFAATQTVYITTGGTPVAGNPPIVITPPAQQSLAIPVGTVIPVTLDNALSSETTRLGDPVTVTVRSASNGDAEFPLGTKINGIVSEVQKAGGGKPGLINLGFRQIVMPDGQAINTQGSLVSLDEKTVQQNADGRLVVRNASKNNQLLFIGIGAAGGYVLGRLTKNTVLGTLLGAAAGYLYSEYDKKNSAATEVKVAQGTQFGVLMNTQIAYVPSPAFALARSTYLNGWTSSGSSSLQTVRVNDGDRAVIFLTDQPVDEAGIVLVPLANVMDQAKIAYKYDERLQAISLDTLRGALQMNIGKSYALLNGEREEMEAPAQVRNGVVYVPLHFLAMATGTRIVWAADTRTATMYDRI